MNPRNARLIKGIVALVAIWVVIMVIGKIAGRSSPSPEKIQAYVEQNPLSEVEDAEARKVHIAKVATMINQLEPAELVNLEEDENLRQTSRAFRQSMTPEENWYFMEKRLGRAFTQMMGLFNQMERNERQDMVEQALKRIRKNADRLPGDGDWEAPDPETVEKVATAGLEAYYKDASAETKMDLAPLLEEIQKVMSDPRRRRSRE